ncbi:YopJ family acetyltransferase [Bradyrhizobium ivorense]|uniref:YopJ family acetyltransferase n=1 Tax=Bradyrhizobium ivorense TaxID=2511166 RepID=UPI0024C0372A|nr:YopJ family acetyltransferase [Bradyrhizobium ivorense]
MLRRTLQRASQAGISPGLVDYGQQVARNLAANIQTDEKLLSLDVDNIDRLADSYNKRYPDLNLRYMGSPASFLEALTNRSSTGAWRAIVRLADGEAHHFAADVRTRAAAAPTVIVMEPADLYTFIAPYSQPRRETLQQLGTEPKWAIIGVGAQKSASDCLMFSMQSALADAMLEHAEINLFHGKRSSRRCFTSTPTRAKSSRKLQATGLVSETKM